MQNDIFKIGGSYTRAHINETLGGSVQSWLPCVDGVVVAACVLPDTNPDAPQVILVGGGHGIAEAVEMWIAQTPPVPVFLKRAANAWEYAGDYRVAKASRDANDIELYSRIAGRSDITRILTMAKAE